MMFLVPISLSASLLTDWALGSQAQGEWTGAGAGADLVPGAGIQSVECCCWEID